MTRSPCSVPSFLRPLVPVEDAAWQACCQQHDDDYKRGGTYRDWCIADARFLLRMLERGVDPAWADAYYQAVRANGWPRFGIGHPVWPAPPVHVEAP